MNFFKLYRQVHTTINNYKDCNRKIRQIKKKQTLVKCMTKTMKIIQVLGEEINLRNSQKDYFEKVPNYLSEKNVYFKNL